MVDRALVGGEVSVSSGGDGGTNGNALLANRSLGRLALHSVVGVSSNSTTRHHGSSVTEGDNDNGQEGEEERVEKQLHYMYVEMVMVIG